ncbi:hypothetical protein ACFSTD_20670 [Novosphingobium colocasiae]
MAYPVAQIAYYSPNLEADVLRHHRLYGSGPFFHAETGLITDFVHRGQPSTIDQSVIFGQWGDIMVEFFFQNNDAPSYCHDSFPYGSGKGGCSISRSLSMTSKRKSKKISPRRCRGRVTHPDGV